MIIKYSRIDSYKVRNKCIQQDWYTRGTCEEYTHMLTHLCCAEYVDEEFGVLVQPEFFGPEDLVDQLEIVANDIYEHSNPDRWEGYDDNPILNIMFELDADCVVSWFEEI
jgi:hypothetical protein